MAKIAGMGSYPKMSDEMKAALKKGSTELSPSIGTEVETKGESSTKKKTKVVNPIEDFNKMVELFGAGFTSKEYEEMYATYNSLQNNYPLRTEMHKDALVRVVKYGFKESQAIANDDAESAAKWGKLCKDARNDAKMNPSQLSAADLSDGITCFSQLSQAVEKEIDVIPILNEYIERPRDRVDYTIYMILDYLRDLEGKPHIDYKDVYQYIFNQRDKNTKKWGEKVVPQDDSPDPDAILVEGED